MPPGHRILQNTYAIYKGNDTNNNYTRTNNAEDCA